MLALLLVLLALVGEGTLTGWTGEPIYVLLAYPAVFFAALAGGLWPGIVATAGALAGGLFFAREASAAGHPLPSALLRLSIFALTGLLMSVGLEQLRRAREAAQMAAEERARREERLAESESRLRELASRHATQAQELEHALRMRDEFLSIATHELRAPIAAMQLSLELQQRRSRRREDEAGDKAAQALDAPLRQLDRLSRMVDTLLDVARIRHGRLELDPEEMDLAAVAEDVVERLRARAASAGSELTCACEGPVRGRWDLLRIEQIVTNLVTNAIKYGAGRPIAVSATASGENARLVVEDHGPGIAPEDQARIFERFERTTDRHKAESLGLGLYIVRELVRAHGGDIEVASALGRGARFTITLPREPPQEAS